VCRRPIIYLAAGLALFLTAVSFAAAQDPPGVPPEPVPLPGLWPMQARLEAPDLSKIRSIRFLTETGYPPFNYIDGEGRLVGFNVELARALCTELKIECIIRTRAWGELLDQLDAGAGDAIVASLAITEATRARVDFTDRYYLTPARFAVRKDAGYGDMTPDGLAGRSIGVIAATAHEAYIERFFPRSKIMRFDTREDAHGGLQDLIVEALFDDAMSLMFWINGTASEGCCAFRGGAYYDLNYFGEGVGIAVAAGNDTLRKALNYGLRKVYQSGKYQELFLRYFPMSYY
jgi:polar amino acid transport system substrate-binding protein